MRTQQQYLEDFEKWLVLNFIPFKTFPKKAIRNIYGVSSVFKDYTVCSTEIED